MNPAGLSRIVNTCKCEFVSEIQELKMNKGLALEDILREIHLFIMRSTTLSAILIPQSSTMKLISFSRTTTNGYEYFDYQIGRH